MATTKPPGARTIALASGVLPDFSPQETVTAAAAAGFDATGVWVDLESWNRTTTREVKGRLADDGLPVLDVEVVWLGPGPQKAEHLRIIDIGAEIGAANVLVVSSDPDYAAAAEKFGQLVDHGAACGVRASLEFGPFTAVKTLANALDMLARCGRPQAGLLVDPLHLSRSGGDAAALRQVASERFAYAQFCDAPQTGPKMTQRKQIIREAVDLRLLPGEGALPLREVLEVLPAGLPISVELRSKALRKAYPKAVDRARAVADATRAYLAAA